MARPTTSTGSKLRTWSWVGAVIWALLGVWSLAEGEVWFGVVQLVFAAAMTVAAMSSRVADLAYTPIFRRK